MDTHNKVLQLTSETAAVYSSGLVRSNGARGGGDGTANRFRFSRGFRESGYGHVTREASGYDGSSGAGQGRRDNEQIAAGSFPAATPTLHGKTWITVADIKQVIIVSVSNYLL